MFPLQNISDYTGYFTKPPLALAGVSPHARECTEHCKGGVLGSHITVEDGRQRRLLNVLPPTVAELFANVWAATEMLDRQQWWLARERHCPVHLLVDFDASSSANEIPAMERVSQRLSESGVAHTFALTLFRITSLKPFAVLLQRSEEVYLNEFYLTSIQALAGLERLRTVSMAVSHGTFSVEPLTACPNLKSVCIDACPDATSLESLGRLEGVRRMKLLECNILSVDFLKDCRLLVFVDVSSCRELTSLDGLSGLRNLLHVDAMMCGLENILGLAGCVALKTLVVSRCTALTSLDGLAGLQNLTTVTAEGSGLGNIQDLKGCVALRTLAVNRCPALTSLDGLAGLQNLTTVTAEGSGLENIRGLKGCVALETLVVNLCPALTSLDGLSGLPNLKDVRAAAGGLRNIQDLRGCTALETLDVSYSQALTSLEGLEGLPNLRVLCVYGSGVPRDVRPRLEPPTT